MMANPWSASQIITERQRTLFIISTTTTTDALLRRDLFCKSRPINQPDQAVIANWPRRTSNRYMALVSHVPCSERCLPSLGMALELARCLVAKPLATLGIAMQIVRLVGANRAADR